MSQKYLRVLSAWVLSTALSAPGIVARATHGDPAPAEAFMHVEVTYTEDAQITDKTKDENGLERTDVSNFSFRATAAFDQRVTMDAKAGGGIAFYVPENTTQKFNGAVSFNGGIKHHAVDEKSRPVFDEVSQMSFAGVLAEDSVAGVPDDNAAGIQFGLQANLPGDCKGKRTLTSFPDGEEKQVETSEINACGYSDESHVAAMITHQPLNVDLRQLPNGKEVLHYGAQFHVTSCNLNPEYCVQLKVAEASASDGPDSIAMSDNWIGATTSGSIAQGFKINLTMDKALKVDGIWKRSLQTAVSVTPVTKSIAVVGAAASGRIEIADRLRLFCLS